jgi:predicted nuclease of predicted toxin-antitoxin system
MKILLDEGLPRRAAALLRERGVDAVHLTEILEPSTSDLTILEHAQESGRVVVTLDADFHAPLAIHGWSSPSVIRIRREGLSALDVCDLVLHLLSDHEVALRSGAVLSVRSHLVGIRKLPLAELPPEEPASTGDDDA